jgi:predicted enzyme related to lactoylglutathione lyase
MKKDFKGLRTCIYRVSDIRKATAWYSNVLGIDPYFNEPFYVGFTVGGYELGLHPEESTEPKGPSVLTYWGVDDVHHVYSQLLSEGASEFEKPEEVGGGIVVAAVKDPWGNIFGIIHNPHFKL